MLQLLQRTRGSRLGAGFAHATLAVAIMPRATAPRQWRAPQAKRHGWVTPSSIRKTARSSCGTFRQVPLHDGALADSGRRRHPLHRVRGITVVDSNRVTQRSCSKRASPFPRGWRYLFRRTCRRGSSMSARVKLVRFFMARPRSRGGRPRAGAPRPSRRFHELSKPSVARVSSTCSTTARLLSPGSSQARAAGLRLMPDSVDVEQYLERIGLRGPVRPDLETLNTILFAHATTVPFENLDVLLGRPIELTPDAPGSRRSSCAAAATFRAERIAAASVSHGDWFHRDAAQCAGALPAPA